MGEIEQFCIQPFSDYTDDSAIVYLEEVRRFVRHQNKLAQRETPSHIAMEEEILILEQRLRELRKARNRRTRRDILLDKNRSLLKKFTFSTVSKDKTALAVLIALSIHLRKNLRRTW